MMKENPSPKKRFETFAIAPRGRERLVRLSIDWERYHIMGSEKKCVSCATFGPRLPEKKSL